MWEWLANRVLRNRIAILIGVALCTAFLGYEASRVQMNYKHGGLLPKTDSAYVEYEQFLKTFSEDGNVMVVGTQGDQLYTPANFKAWHDLGNDLGRIHGIDSIFSEAHLYELVRDDSLKRFTVQRVTKSMPATQAEMDTALMRIRSLPFYEGLLFNGSTKASLMMVFVNAKLFDTDERQEVVSKVADRVEAFGEATGMPIHVSGLPWIRVKSTQLVKGEMPIFMGLSMAVCGFLLLLFFRSWRVMWICLGVVGISVVWSFGAMALLDYKITILQSVIAPLVIVTGVPNCVFLINAYHYEFVRHGNKMKSLQRVISRIGAAAFMTNATTAVFRARHCTFVHNQATMPADIVWFDLQGASLVAKLQVRGSIFHAVDNGNHVLIYDCTAGQLPLYSTDATALVMENNFYSNVTTGKYDLSLTARDTQAEWSANSGDGPHDGTLGNGAGRDARYTTAAGTFDNATLLFGETDLARTAKIDASVTLASAPTIGLNGRPFDRHFGADQFGGGGGTANLIMKLLGVA